MSTEVSPLSRISLAVEPPVARVTLNNAPLNVIDLAMMEELGSALADIEAEPKISTVVLRGDGDCFSAGVDVVAHAPGKVTAMLQKFHAVIRALVASRKVTVAAVHGNCLGGGAELAMMCDIVITTADATWGFPEINLGCFPPVAATALSALIGQKRATDLMLTGATMLGTEAAERFDDVQSNVTETVERVSRETGKFIRERPWTAVAIVAVAGIVIGWLTKSRD